MAEQQGRQTARRVWPNGLGPILFLELWERFSYYGMRSLLMLYMTQEMALPIWQAGRIYGLYTGLAYALPVLGGLLADRVLGERRAIFWGALAMAVGHLLLVARGWPPFLLALGLLVLGTGLFKANTATLLGKLFQPGDVGREQAYAWFYMTVNVGALLAPLVCGALAAGQRWHWGFGAAGLGMALGLAVWCLFEHRLGAVGQRPAPAARGRRAAPRAPLGPIERERMWALVVLSVLGNISLWAAIGQAGSTLTLFADREMNLHLPLVAWRLPASSLQATNPFFIIAGVPLMGLVWRRLEARGARPTPPVQFAIGLALVALGFGTLSVAGLCVDHGLKVSVAWLIVATLLNTAGELCVSPLGLSLVSRYAPKELASVVMGLWYATMAVANAASGQLAGLYELLDKSMLFVLPSVWCAAMALVLLALRRPLTRWLHEPAAPPLAARPGS